MCTANGRTSKFLQKKSHSCYNDKRLVIRYIIETKFKNQRIPFSKGFFNHTANILTANSPFDSPAKHPGTSLHGMAFPHSPCILLSFSFLFEQHHNNALGRSPLTVRHLHDLPGALPARNRSFAVQAPPPDDRHRENAPHHRGHRPPRGAAHPRQADRHPHRLLRLAGHRVRRRRGDRCRVEHHPQARGRLARLVPADRPMPAPLQPRGHRRGGQHRQAPPRAPRGQLDELQPRWHAQPRRAAAEARGRQVLTQRL